MDHTEYLAIIVAGACHDHDHPGYNNVYMVDSQDEIAYKYNGKSPHPF